MFARLLALQIWLAAIAAAPVFAQGQPSGLAKAICDGVRSGFSPHAGVSDNVCP